MTFLFASLAAALASAFEPGELLLIKSGQATLRLDDGKTKTLEKSSLVEVRSEVGNDIRVVTVPSSGAAVEGAIRRGDVGSLRDQVDYLTAEIKKSPKSHLSYLHFMRGMAHRERNDYQRAIDDFDKSLALEPKDASTLANRAHVRTLQGDFEQAIADYDKAIKINPTSTAYLCRRAYLRGRLGEWNKALADLDEALRLEPENVEAITYRANAFKDQGALDQASVEYEKALKVNPKWADAFVGRAHAAQLKGDWDKAIADYDQALRHGTPTTLILCNRGYAWQMKGGFDNALADFDAATKLNPKDSSSFTCRARLYQQYGELDKAAADFTAAIKLAPANSLGYVERAAIWQLKGDWTRAEKDFEKAIQINASDHEAHNELARQLSVNSIAKHRDGKRAVQHATKACELTQFQNPSYLDTLALAYAEQKDFKNALQWIEKAIQLANETEKAEFEAHRDLFKARRPFRNQDVAPQ